MTLLEGVFTNSEYDSFSYRTSYCWITPLAFSGADQATVAVEGLVSTTVRFTGGESGSERKRKKKQRAYQDFIQVRFLIFIGKVTEVHDGILYL